MRLLSSIDWPLFFERVSLVEQILREDPAGAYARMDFPTRDRYRHSVEELARAANASEQDVARRAVDLAAAARQTAPERDRTHHVGYYLISRGRFQLEARGRLPADAPRPIRALLLRPSGPRLPGHDRLGHGARRRQLRRLRAPQGRRHGRSVADGVRRAPAAQRAGHQPDQPRRHLAGQPAAAAQARHAGRHPGQRIARSWQSRRSSIPKRAWCRSSTTSRCGSSRTGTRTCTSRCSRTLPTPTSRRGPTTPRSSRRHAGASTS